MKGGKLARVIVGLVFLLGSTLLGGVGAQAADRPAVRFAACGTCTAEGVEALILKQTNIAKLLGLDLKVLFLNPPAMGAGVASNSLDVEWIGDQPTLAQLSNGIPIKIAGYQFDFELRLEATPSISSIQQLAGKKIGVPFGTTAYELASEVAAAHGFPASAIVNVAPADLGTALHEGQVAAVSIWDPLWGILEKNYKTVPLSKVFHTGFVCMRAGFVRSDRQAAVKFLAAQILAIAFRAGNLAEADRRYEAAFGIPTDVAQAAQSIDRSIAWKSPDEVRLELLDKDYKDLATTQAFLLKNKLIPRAIDIKPAVDMSLWRDALKLISSSGISIAKIRYVSNAK